MEAGDQIVDVPSMDGGKKRRSNKNKKGGAIDIGSVLAPVVLYGLRRSFKPKKQRGGDAFSSQASPIAESTGPLLAVIPVVPPAGVAVVPPSIEQVAPVDMPKEAGAVPTDSGNASLAGGAKKSKKEKKSPMAEGRFGVKGKLGPLAASTGVYGKMKLYGGDNHDDDIQQEGGKKKRRNNKKGPMAEGRFGVKGKLGPLAASTGVYGKMKLYGGDNHDDDIQQEGGKKKRRNNKKGGDKEDKDNQQDGGKKKRNSKKLKGGALDLYAQQLQNISTSLNALLFN